VKILLTGASGQVGHALLHTLRGLGEVTAPGRAALDLAELDSVRSWMREQRPDLVVNAAAFTNVERAESEPDAAFRINAEAPGVLAQEARALGAAMVHYSTDYVFDGLKNGPYVETDAPAPLNRYGRSKLAGEQAVAGAGIDYLILRTSWVYGAHGHNFLRTMLRLARERGQVRVVNDQFGAPTWSRTVASVTASILEQAKQGGAGWWQRHRGMYHLSSQGSTSWHGFAEAIMAEAGIDCEVEGIASAEYPTLARRPLNSTLCCNKLLNTFGPLPEWRAALHSCVSEMQMNIESD
jgi:dTDP-4-dehydrorhamnose reductase